MLLHKLSNLDGAAGDEGRVRKFIQEKIKRYVDSIEVDALGNLICFKNARKKRPVILIAAHMDEVGFMITGKRKDGTLGFAKVGGIDSRVILAKTLRLGKKQIKGVIGVKPVHLLKKEEATKIPQIDEMYIDIGAESDSDVKDIEVGDYAYFDTYYEKASKGIVKGKAFDDRVGCSLILELFKEKFSFPIYGVFSTQEEIGLRGAKVIGNRIKPDYAIILEGTGAGDFPSKRDNARSPFLGKGPTLTVMDKSMIADRELLESIIKVANREGIPYQLKQPNIGGTDAGKIQISQRGVKCAVIAVPARYIHSPVGLMDMGDYNKTLKLTNSTLKYLGKRWG